METLTVLGLAVLIVLGLVLILLVWWILKALVEIFPLLAQNTGILSSSLKDIRRDLDDIRSELAKD